jgi:hypothetical protein
MPKCFREVSKHFAGDKTLASQYMGVARSLLGGLKEMSGNVYQNIRHVVLPDGTKITVGFAGAISQLAIDVRAAVDSLRSIFTVRMETGGIVIEPGAGVVPKSMIRMYGSYIEDYINDVSVKIKLLWTLILYDNPLEIYGSYYSDEHAETSKIYGATVPLEPIEDDLYAYASDEQRYKYDLIRYVKCSHFTGKTRLFVQAILGSRPDRIWFLPEIYNLAPTNKIVYIDGKVVTESTGIFVDENDVYWLVTPAISGGSVSFNEILFDEVGGFFKQLAKLTSDVDDKDRYESYAFSRSTLADGRQTSSAIASITGAPLAWGWHFNWDGTSAVITTIEDDSGNALVESRVYTLSVHSGEPLPTATLSGGAVHEFKMNEGEAKIFVPTPLGHARVDFIYRVGGIEYSNIPIYAFYSRDGTLKSFDYSYSTEPGYTDPGYTPSVCGTGTDSSTATVYSIHNVVRFGSVSTKSGADVQETVRTITASPNGESGATFFGWSLYDNLGFALCQGGPLAFASGFVPMWWGATGAYTVLNYVQTRYASPIYAVSGVLTMVIPFDSCDGVYILKRDTTEAWFAQKTIITKTNTGTNHQALVLDLTVGYHSLSPDPADPQPSGLGVWKTGMYYGGFVGGVTTYETVTHPETVETTCYLTTSTHATSFAGPESLDTFFFRLNPEMESRVVSLIDSAHGDYVHGTGSLINAVVRSGSGYTEVPTNFIGWA